MTTLRDAFYRFIAGMNFLGSIWIAVLMAIITADVVGRALFSFPLYGVPEIVKVSIVGLVWLQMAHTLRRDGHLRSRLILDRVPPRVQDVFEMIAFFLGAVVFILIAWSAWDGMINAWSIGEFEGERPARIPTAPVRTIVIAGACLTAIEFAILFVQRSRDLSGSGTAQRDADGTDPATYIE